jgi:hypothetical protein
VQLVASLLHEVTSGNTNNRSFFFWHSVSSETCLCARQFSVNFFPSLLNISHFAISVSMTVTLLVSGDKGLISFHEMLYPMLLSCDTWTEVILRIQLIWWLHWSVLLSTSSKEFLRHSIPKIPFSGRPHTFRQFHQIFRNKP